MILEKTLKNHGKNVLPIKVFALCSPQHSSKLLEKDNERIVSSLMPCRISVYEKSNGKTYISRMKSLPMAKTFGGTIEQVMIESSKEVEKILQPLIISS